MCGIAGIISRTYQIDPKRILAMSESIKHRGPDGKWEWYQDDLRAGLAYRRLAIMDKEAFNQNPFIWQNKYVVLFNGEIYNHQELRKQLEPKGFRFQTKSDVEVIPPLYQLYGTSMAEHMEGMFAIAIWDIENKTLFAVRDRFGEKPFYYALDKNEFVFASEMKSIIAGGLTKEWNGSMLFDYLVYNVVEDAQDAHKTFYSKIFRLPPAHWLLLKDGAIREGEYWTLNNAVTYGGKLEEAVKTFSGLFDYSVASMLKADKTIGFSVSGGLDSSAVYTQALKYWQNDALPNTFTVRVHENKFDEGPYVNTLLNHYSANHHEVWVNEDLILQKLPLILYHQEEPISDLTVLAQWMLMEKVSEKKVNVLLDGQGADETLAGYNYFYEVLLKQLGAQSWRKMMMANRAFFEKQGKYYPIRMRMAGDIYFPGILNQLGRLKRRYLSPVYFSFLNRDFLHTYKHNDTPFPVFNDVNQLLHYRTARYGLHKLLRYADRNSMAHGIEVRFPFLNHKLVEFIFTLPLEFKLHDGWTKFILRMMMDKQLPSSITWRINKLGYHVPSDKWLEHPRVKEMIRESKRKMAQSGIVHFNDRAHPRDLAIFIGSHFL